MITNGRQIVGTTAVKIDGRSTKYSRLYIHNDDTTKELYIGGQDVTVNNGFIIEKLGQEEFDLPPLNDIYMVSSGANHSVSWIRVEVD